MEANLMQAVNQQQPVSAAPPITLRVSVEFIAYLVLIVFALLLRLADLDIVPMSDVEAMQALPAYHVRYPAAPGEPQPAQSPVVFWLQLTSFSVLGGNELAARLPGVLGGVMLILMPLLFRDRIGRERALWLSLLLGLSPIAFAAARFADPAVWTVTFALGLLWAIWHYWESRKSSDAVIAALFLGALAFLSEPGGLLLLLILALAAYVTIWWMVLNAPEDRDTPGDELWLAAREFVSNIPVQKMLIALVALVALASTCFTIYPAGLNTVAEVVRGFLLGFVRPYQAGTPPVMAILTLFVYNLWLVIFAVIAAVVLVVNRQATFFDRFAIVWAVIAFVALFLYRGSRPGYALYIALPMMWLSARLIHELTVNYAPVLLTYDGFRMIEDEDAYWWIKWTLAAIVLSLLVMLMVHWQEIGRGLMQLPQENMLAALSEPRFAPFKSSSIWFIISVMFIAVGYFLAASIWGHINALQGFGLGFVLFILGAGVGRGWNTAVQNATNPYEIWNNTTITQDAYLLRTTLFEAADRDTKGFPLISLSIVRDEAAGISDDSIIAWLVRDFPNARFVDSVDAARRDEVVLMPKLEEDPNLGGSYVGQRFLIRQNWSLSDLRAVEWISWLGQRHVPTRVVPGDTVVLWLRIDIYDGVPAVEGMRG